jgi:hypothetical protein
VGARRAEGVMPVVLNARKVGHYLDDTYYIGRPSKSCGSQTKRLDIPSQVV